MKLVYIISMGHSGSTLSDLILGNHPEFISSGELRYLNWQLHRTKNKKGSKEDGDICTCGRDFRNCEFWSQVLAEIKTGSGKDIAHKATSFDLAYFGSFSYQERGGFTRSFWDKFTGYIAREWCELGYSYNSLPLINYRIDNWLKNNWTLYEAMSKVGKRSVVIDSSKDLAIALLLQQYKPKEVTLVFLHRSSMELAASHKKWALKKEEPLNFESILRAKEKYEQRILKCKKNIRDLSFVDIDYGEMVKRPIDFINKVANSVGLETNKLDYLKDGKFYIDPESHHLVGGNPMRYKGKREVVHDRNSDYILSNNEVELIHSMTNSRK